MLEDDARVEGWGRRKEAVVRILGGFLLGDGRGGGKAEIRAGNDAMCAVLCWQREWEMLLLGLRYERKE